MFSNINASCSSHSGSFAGATNNNQDTCTGNTGDADIMSSFDDYFSALFAQVLLISEDRETGHLGKLVADSDAQIAIEYMLQEARELEQSYRLAKSLSTCGSVPSHILEEMTIQDSQIRSDRELAERIERREPRAESSLQATNARFDLALQYFNTMSECCSCSGNKRAYVVSCGHAYCEECARSLYSQALTNRTLIPVRCCKQPFASDIAAVCLTDTGDINKYESMKREIESPCPPVAELDVTASKLISEKGWKVCFRCGAVVERMSGCVHITCMCRNEFCYTCLKPWRTCSCELYPVEELNQILNERIGNNDPGTARHRLRNVLQNYYQHEHTWQRQVPNGRILQQGKLNEANIFLLLQCKAVVDHMRASRR
ncbi:hypothetical protein CPB97_001116 [Podila verticillata]|nr:hypothetical protein CPB97_001116 [Podila verticillata]